LNCKACNREAGEREFCAVHLKSYENIVEAYSSWRKSLKIPWKRYLRKIKENPFTGVWAKEVAEYLISSEEEENVKKS
jgi:hypothetical protein